LDDARLISLSEAAAEFGLSHSHLHLLARIGKLRARKIGQDWLTMPKSVTK
jgi:hypothetical protein